jgi:hypothetical protein
LKSPGVPITPAKERSQDQPQFDKSLNPGVIPHLRSQLVNLEFQLKLEQKKVAELKRQMEDYSNAALETIAQERSTNDGLRRQLCLCQEKYRKLTMEYRPPLEIFNSIEMCDRALSSLTTSFRHINSIKVSFSTA